MNQDWQDDLEELGDEDYIPESEDDVDTSNLIDGFTLTEILESYFNNKKKMAEDKKEEKVQYSQWLKRGTSTFIPADNSNTQKELDAGVYNIRFADGVGFYLFKKNLNLDELVDLPMKEGDAVVTGIKTFWEREEKFKEYGYTYKRGVLLYGEAGMGKSCLINKLCKHLVEKLNGIVIYISQSGELDSYYKFSSEILRVIEPNRRLVVCIEDIDGLCAYKENETTLLNILDGVNQINNVVYIGTTNFPENLTARILNRPSRFDLRIEVKAPNAECREIYFKAKLKDSDLNIIDLKSWVDQTEGMSMAHLGELIKSVIIIGNTFEETIQRLVEMKKLPSSHEFGKETKSIGYFGKKTG